LKHSIHKMFNVLLICLYRTEKKEFKKVEVISCIRIFCAILEFRERRLADSKHLSTAAQAARFQEQNR